MEEKKALGSEIGEKSPIQQLYDEVDDYKDAVLDAKLALSAAEDELFDAEHDSSFEENENRSNSVGTLRRISSIIVRQLFGLYSYEIPINPQYTILHSVNGKGKTTILKLIEAIIKLDLYTLDVIPFSSFSLAFSDGGVIEVKKQSPQYSLIREVIENKLHNYSERNAIAHSSWEEKMGIIISIKETNESEPQIILSDEMVEKDLGIIIYRTIRDCIPHRAPRRIEADDFSQQIKENLRSIRVISKAAEMIEEYTGKLECTFIEANRIKITRGRGLGSARYADDYESFLDTDEQIEKCDDNLLRKINGYYEEYLRKTEVLNMSFLKRATIAMSHEKHDKSDHDIKAQLDKLKDQIHILDDLRREYEKYGLLNKDNSNDSSLINIIEYIPEKPTTDMLAMHEVYVEDYAKRLSVVDPIYKKIRLFLQIINGEHKFTDKVLMIHDGVLNRRLHGEVFYFEGTNGNQIRLRQLSSGEKNDFILFYKMIFETNSNTLLLMDEPEISTHITWQMLFSREVYGICQETGMQVIVATHSPNIVRDFDKNVIVLREVKK